MFTGIVKGLYTVTSVERLSGLMQLTIELDEELVQDLKVGASVAIDGTCLTATNIDGAAVSFDVIQETLERTTLSKLEVGYKVNVERSLRFGDEVGGHILSGHVFGTATIEQVNSFDNNHEVLFRCPSEWMKYILPKGFIALDGASLTITEVWDTGLFSVHLIPETLKLTTFGFKGVGNQINVEIDAQTQAIVNSVERVMTAKSSPSV